MPWVWKRNYQKLLRKANDNLAGRGKNEYSQGISDLGFLLWRLNPERSKNLKEGSLWPMPFDHIDVYADDEKVFIFLVSNGKPLIFEDDFALYPSDELVAKLRFLLK